MLLVNTNAVSIPLQLTLPFVAPVPALLLGLTLCVVVLFIKRYPNAPLPLIGHLLIFLRPRIEYMQWYLDRSRSLGAGKTFPVIFPGFGRTFFVTDPACIKHVLVNKPGDFTKAGLYASLTRDFFGSGILLAVGEQWRTQRFAGQVFASQLMLDHIANVVLPRNLPRMFATFDEAARDDAILNFESVAADLTLAVFGEVAFDVDSDRLLGTVADPFDRVLAGISRRFINPFWQWTERITPKGRELRRDIATVRTFSRKMVAETLAELQDEQVGGKVIEDGRAAVIRSLLDSGTVMSVEEIADSCTTFLVAGRDTTADAITWMLYALLRNPPYLARLVAEIDSINDVPNNEVLSRLPLLDNAISETLRLYPSVPINLTENTTQSPSVLPDGTVVEPQEHVVFSPWVMARLPEVYGEDASEFRPERWTEMKHKPTAWELPIFHAGPRSCLGQTMAKMEMGIVLKEILKNYEFEMGWDGGERFMGEGITHPMQDGLPVWVRRRVKV